MNIAFGGEDGGGIYHSIYDDFYWYTHFSDTNFQYGRALAQTGGTAILRLADADLLPFEFGDFADTMDTYVKELKTLAQKTQADIQERNREIEEGVFQATDDPKKPLIAPPVETVPPYLNFAPLDNATVALGTQRHGVSQGPREDKCKWRQRDGRSLSRGREQTFDRERAKTYQRGRVAQPAVV